MQPNFLYISAFRLHRNMQCLPTFWGTRHSDIWLLQWALIGLDKICRYQKIHPKSVLEIVSQYFGYQFVHKIGKTEKQMAEYFTITLLVCQVGKKLYLQMNKFV